MNRYVLTICRPYDAILQRPPKVLFDSLVFLRSCTADVESRHLIMPFDCLGKVNSWQSRIELAEHVDGGHMILYLVTGGVFDMAK